MGSRCTDTHIDKNLPQEEAEAITGSAQPEEAAARILARPGAATQMVAVKLGSQGAVLVTRDPPATYRQHALLVRALNPEPRKPDALHCSALTPGVT